MTDPKSNKILYNLRIFLKPNDDDDDDDVKLLLVLTKSAK